jgi:two-component system CheB/CheR fusion protein
LVIPKLFEGRGADDEVRVWVTGCSTGEEAYSLAILLREQCEKLVSPPKVQIFATDIDEQGMSVARAALPGEPRQGSLARPTEALLCP